MYAAWRCASQDGGGLDGRRSRLGRGREAYGAAPDRRTCARALTEARLSRYSFLHTEFLQAKDAVNAALVLCNWGRAHRLGMTGGRRDTGAGPCRSHVKVGGGRGHTAGPELTRARESVRLLRSAIELLRAPSTHPPVQHPHPVQAIGPPASTYDACSRLRQAYAAVMHELGASCHQLALLLWHALESAAWEDGAGTELDSVLQTGLRAGEHMLEVARNDAERRTASDQCASFHTLLGRFAALRLAHATNRPQARTVCRSSRPGVL